jgi:hypothetical protein
MSILNWFKPIRHIPTVKDGYVKTLVENVVVGDEIKHQGVVIKKYRHYTMWELGFKGGHNTFITKGEYVWVKQ